MDRTADRPLPAGRLSDREVLWFGGLTIVVGARLSRGCRESADGGAGRGDVGAVCRGLHAAEIAHAAQHGRRRRGRRLPTLMGWTAVGGSLSFALGGGGLKAATLFLIVYLWQFPHFMAIAWIYRRQYAQAGLKMLTVVDPTGWRAGTQAVAAALALCRSAWCRSCNMPGPVYFVAASALGLIYLAAAAVFLPLARRTHRPAGCCGSAWYICRRCCCCSCWFRWFRSLVVTSNDYYKRLDLDWES